MGKPKTKTPEPASTEAQPTHEEQIAAMDAAIQQAEIDDREGATPEELEDAASDADAEAHIAKPNSVVKRKYKIRYKERAKEQGQRSKAAKRSNWDWLAQTIAANTLDTKAHIDIGAFERILDLNGVKHAHWNRTTKGWQGRLRMTGRLALQTIVAEKGTLEVEGDTLEAPADWVAKYRN